MCKTITRLCRRWVQRCASGAFFSPPAPPSSYRPPEEAPVPGENILSMPEADLCACVVSILPRLERSHSWLRTVSLSRACPSLSPPIKALMELLVSFKKTVVTLPPEAISPEVRELISFSATGEMKQVSLVLGVLKAELQ